MLAGAFAGRLGEGNFTSEDSCLEEDGRSEVGAALIEGWRRIGKR